MPAEQESRVESRAPALVFLVLLLISISDNAWSLDLEVQSDLDVVEDNNELLTFSLTVTNDSGGTASSVVVNATTPEFLSVRVSDEATGGGVCLSFEPCTQGEIIQWSLGSMGAGETRVVRFAGYVSSLASEGDTLTLNATVENLGGVQDTASHTVAVKEEAPPLALALEADRHLIASGERLTYRLRYSNRGAVTANTLSLTLPSSVSFVSATGGVTPVGNVVTWSPNLSPGLHGAVEVIVNANSGLTDGQLLLAQAALSNLNGDTATARDYVAVDATPQLELSMHASIDAVQDDNLVTFTMTVTNVSGGTLFDALLEAITPAYMSIRANDDTTGSGSCLAFEPCTSSEVMQWSLGTMQAGETRVVHFSGYVSSLAGEGDLLIAHASVRASASSTASDSHAIVVTEGPTPLTLSLEADKHQVESNEQIIYRLRYSNRGTTTANSIQLTLPPELSFDTATGAFTHSNGLVTWSPAVLPGQDGVFEVIATSDSGLSDGSLLRASAMFSNIAGNVTTAADVVSVDSNPAMRISIQAASDSIHDDNLITYVVTVTNTSGGDLLDGLIEVPTPEYLSFDPSDDSTGGGSCLAFEPCTPAEVIQWNLGTMSDGETRVVHFADYVSATADEGDLLVAHAVFSATGAGSAADHHSVVVKEEIPDLALALESERHLAGSDDDLIFRLRYSNRGSTIANDLSVVLPDGLTLVSADGSPSVADGILIWSSLGASAGTHGVLELITRTADTGLDGGDLLAVSAALTNSAGTTATANEVVSVRESPPLDIAIHSSVDAIQDDNFLTYTMTVTNTGPEELLDVVVEALTPEYFSLDPSDDATAGGYCVAFNPCSPAEVIRWDLGSLALGESRVLRFSDYVSASADDGDVLWLHARASATGAAGVVADSHSIIINETTPPLTLALEAQAHEVGSNEEFTYRLRYSNNGSVSANSIKLRLPPEVSFSCLAASSNPLCANSGGVHSDGLVTWSGLNISPGEEGAVEAIVTTNAGLSAGTLLKAHAVFTNSDGNTATASDEVVVNEAPPFSLQIFADKDAVQDDTELTFTVRVKNTSGGDLFDSTVQFITPDYFSSNMEDNTFPTADCLAFSPCTSGEVFEWNLGTLGAGEERDLMLVDFISASADDGDLLIAHAQVQATGTSTVADSYSVIVSEDAVPPLPNLSSPMPGGFSWIVSVETGGFNCRDPENPVVSHLERNWHSIDFTSRTTDNPSQPLAPTYDVPIYAAAGGRVETVGIYTGNPSNQPNGHYVVIDHDSDGSLATGMATRYLHLRDAPLVSENMPVVRGQLLGYMGDTGISYGEHLHFGVRWGNDGSSTVPELNNVLMEGLPLREYRSRCSEGEWSGGYPSTNAALPPDEDADGDGANNDVDAFPYNPNETLDTDGDGVGNNADSDDDGDGIADTRDIDSLDPLVGRVRMDFDADADGDFLLRDDTTGSWSVVRMESLDAAGEDSIALFSNLGFEYRTAADFDDDGDADILLQRSLTSAWQLFEVQNGAVVGSANLSGIFRDSAWEFQVGADFDNDGDADIVLRNAFTGAWRLFEMEALAVVDVRNMSLFRNLDWAFVGAGDVDADGDEDIVLRNTSTGAWRVFEMQDLGRLSVHNFAGVWSNLTWEYQGLSDMDRDGDTDLLVRNTTTSAWRVFEIENIVAPSGASNPGLFGQSDWALRCLSDFDNDGDEDALMRNATTGGWRVFEIESRDEVSISNPGLSSGEARRIFCRGN